MPVDKVTMDILKEVKKIIDDGKNFVIEVGLNFKTLLELRILIEEGQLQEQVLDTGFQRKDMKKLANDLERVGLEVLGKKKAIDTPLEDTEEKIVKDVFENGGEKTLIWEDTEWARKRKRVLFYCRPWPEKEKAYISHVKIWDMGRSRKIEENDVPELL